MSFKKIDARDKRSRVYTKEPLLTIGKGKILLNAAAIRTIGKTTDKVEILIDEKNMRLAIRKAENSDLGAFPLVKPKNYLGGSINSKKLVRDIRGVNDNQTKMYKAVWDDREKMLIIELHH